MRSLALLLLLASTSLFARQEQDVEPPAGPVAALLREPAPTVAIRPPVLEDLDGLDCARCHAPVVAEWAASAHALAWVDEDYRDALRGKRRKASCYGCHIPEPLLATGSLPERVRPRDPDGVDAHFGVSCESCHRGPDDTILGPWGVATDAHTSARSPLHLPAAEAGASGGSDALCSACHATTIGPVIGIAKDFHEAGLAARGLSCVGCHMAPVERRWAHAPGADPEGDETAPLRRGRSHALQTPRDPAFLRLAFGWSLEGGDSAPVLVLSNQAGHRVPGLIGRYVTFHVTSLAADGAELATESFTLDTTAYLPVDGTRAIPLAAGAAGARIVGEHEDPREAEAFEFLRQTLERE